MGVNVIDELRDAGWITITAAGDVRVDYNIATFQPLSEGQTAVISYGLFAGADSYVDLTPTNNMLLAIIGNKDGSASNELRSSTQTVLVSYGVGGNQLYSAAHCTQTVRDDTIGLTIRTPSTIPMSAFPLTIQVVARRTITS
jgi:hypothetical protein